MAYSSHNTIPPHILDLAIRAYVQTVEPVRDICARFKISHATLQRERRARGISPRPPDWRERPTRKGARGDRFALEPQTPKQRAVWLAWQREPHAGPQRLAELSGATRGYVSRLVGHWRAVEEGWRPEPARCPHCGGALGEARRGG
jgi:hypothetical protein